MSSNIRTHLEALYRPHIEAGRYPADALMSLSWQEPKMFPSTRLPLSDFDGIESKLEQLVSRGKNSYYRVSPLANKQYSEHSRGAASDGLGIPALYLDIDTADGVHKSFLGDQSELPHPTEDQALEMAFAIADPTLVVKSGGGLHVYYRLDKPLSAGFKDSAGRLLLDRGHPGTQFLARFDAFAVAEAHDRGFGIDKGISADTARVLRLSGTKNFKNPENPQPVRILHCDPSVEHRLSDLEQKVPALPQRPSRGRSRFSEQLRTSPEAAVRAVRVRTQRARAFEEKVPVSFLMEELWNMDSMGENGWALPSDDGWITTETAHAKTIKTTNGKVEMVVAYGARLQDAWGVPDFRTAMSSWDLLLVALSGNMPAADLVALTHPTPDSGLIDLIQTLADQNAVAA